LFVALGLLLVACGSSAETATADDAAPVAEADESTESEPDASDSAPAATGESMVDVVAGSTDEINGGKPTSILPSGAAPIALETVDLIEGDGATAAPGDLLTMHYVGVLQADGSEFDTSWGRGTFGFPLGEGRVIQGWD